MCLNYIYFFPSGIGFPRIKWDRILPLCSRILTASRGLVSVDSLKAAGSAYVFSGNILFQLCLQNMA